MSPIEQVNQTDSLVMMWKVFRAARFELTFVAVLLVLYLAIVLTRSKVGAKGRAPKKDRAIVRTSMPTNRGDRPHATQRIAETHDGHGSPELKSARELDAVLQGKSTACITDPAWLIPRVVDSCHTDAQNAFLVFRKAQRAGLNLAQASESDAEQLFTALVTSMIRLNRHSDAKQLLQEMQAIGCSVTQHLRTSVVKLCTSKQAFNEALGFNDLFPMLDQSPALISGDKSVWSCLLFCAVEAKAYHRCRDLFARLKASGTPSQKDYWNMVRWGSAQGDWSAILQFIQEMREYNVEADNVIYNTALASASLRVRLIRPDDCSTRWRRSRE
jgi:pentatricopeptide repeat protein